MIEHFHRPGTIREALAFKARYGSRSAFLAGGTWLNSRDSADPPAHCISLERLGLDRIAAQRGQVSIGATCTLQQLIDDDRVPPPLRRAAAQIVSRNIRNMGTIGGHLASRLPFSDLVPMLIALDAAVVLSRPGGPRTVRLTDYVVKPHGGLLTKIVVPRPARGRLAACRNVRASANSRSLLSAAISLAFRRGAIRDPVIALGGVAGHVIRLTALEEELHGKPMPALDDLQARVSRAVRPTATPSASAAFTRYQAGAIVALTFRDALSQREERP